MRGPVNLVLISSGLFVQSWWFHRTWRRKSDHEQEMSCVLSLEERGPSGIARAKGKEAARKLDPGAHALLKADCSPIGPAWYQEQISAAPANSRAIAVNRV